MKVNFFPGCSLSASAKGYHRSLRWVFNNLGIELKELPDWSCCGASSAHSLNHNLAYALSARNLMLAQGFKENLMVACSACYSRLKITEGALKDNAFRSRMERLIGSKFDPDPQPKVRSILEVLREERQLKELKAKAKNLKIKVACYYGCLLTRIPRVSPFDSVENPTSMERIVEAVGAMAVAWPYKTDCCGASFSVIAEEIFLDLSFKILHRAAEYGAGVIVTSCPFCQYNLDYAQWLRRKEDRKVIPVLFITQLIGIALGAAEKEILIGANLTGAAELEKMCYA
jgi:heterodisulfide reductase subunit B